jgi:hypothetical protein
MRHLRLAIVALLVVAASAPPASGAPLLWKTVADAFLRINDEGVKEWNVFETEKKTKKEKTEDRFLIQIADRYLFVDSSQRKVFDLESASIVRSSDGVMWDPANLPADSLNTSEWLVRDVGVAQRIKMHLDDENRTLDLQIPHRATRR